MCTEDSSDDVLELWSSHMEVYSLRIYNCMLYAYSPHS